MILEQDTLRPESVGPALVVCSASAPVAFLRVSVRARVWTRSGVAVFLLSTLAPVVFPCFRLGLKSSARLAQFGRVDQVDLFKMAFPWPMNDRQAPAPCFQLSCDAMCRLLSRVLAYTQSSYTQQAGTTRHWKCVLYSEGATPHFRSPRASRYSILTRIVAYTLFTV